MSDVQELYTRDHGTIKVKDISFQDGGYHIVRTPNGSYMHVNGLPIKSEKELRAALPVEYLQEALDWFRNRHEEEDNPVRALTFNRSGDLVFVDDGSLVLDLQDLYAFYNQPSEIQATAIVALKRKQKELEAQAGTAKLGPRGPAKAKTAGKAKVPAKKTGGNKKAQGPQAATG